MRKSMVFGGAAVTLLGGLGGVAALQTTTGATTWAHNTTPIKVGIVRDTTSGKPKTFKATMTNNTGTAQKGSLCVDYYTTSTPTRPTTLTLEDFSCKSTETVPAGKHMYTTFLENTGPWPVVEARWKNSTGTVSKVKAITFSVP